jgi:hypothetical protein
MNTYLRNREYGINKKTQFNNILQKKCIIELSYNKMDLFNYMLQFTPLKI